MQKAKIKKNKPKNRTKKRRRHSPGGCCGNAKTDTQKTKHLKVDGGWNDDSHVTYVNQVTPFTFLPHKYGRQAWITAFDFIKSLIWSRVGQRCWNCTQLMDLKWPNAINVTAVGLLLEVIKSFMHGIYARFCEANSPGYSHKWLTQASLFSTKNVMTIVCCCYKPGGSLSFLQCSALFPIPKTEWLIPISGKVPFPLIPKLLNLNQRGAWPALWPQLCAERSSLCGPFIKVTTTSF